VSQAVQPHLSNDRRIDGVEVFQWDLHTEVTKQPGTDTNPQRPPPSLVGGCSSHPFASSEFLRFWSAPHCA
jgi:hypothetical protein